MLTLSWNRKKTDAKFLNNSCVQQGRPVGPDRLAPSTLSKHILTAWEELKTGKRCDGALSGEV